MQPEIFEEARKIDIGQPIPGEEMSSPPRYPQPNAFLDYGVPALLIGAGLAWYTVRNESRFVRQAKLKSHLVAERIRETLEERFDKDEEITHSVRAGVSESLVAMEPAGGI